MSSVFVEPEGWNLPPKNIIKTIYQCNCCTYFCYDEEKMKDHCLCYTVELSQGRKTAI